MVKLENFSTERKMAVSYNPNNLSVSSCNYEQLFLLSEMVLLQDPCHFKM